MNWINSRGFAAWAGMSVLFLASPAPAHNPQTSYARIGIQPRQVEFKLTYDLLTLLKMAPLDQNGDGQISRAELSAGAPQIETFLRKHIFPEINSQEAMLGELLTPVWPSDAGNAITKKDYQQRIISFVFRNQSTRNIAEVSICFDFFAEVGEGHTILGLFACGKHEQDVIFTRFEPDYLYDTTVVPTGSDEVVAVSGPGSQEGQTFAATLWGQMFAFVKLGIHHIFLGYDHILFLMGLMIVSKFWDLVKIVTSFTIAHTMTLCLATLHIVNLSARFIEVAIALTIIYVAVENLWIKEAKNRWRLTFAFGLIHGFGFANVLGGMELPSTGLMRCLLSFNVGVEIGQLAILLTAFPLLWWLSRQTWNVKAQMAVSMGILVVGFGWFLERTFGLGFMPF